MNPAVLVDLLIRSLELSYILKSVRRTEQILTTILWSEFGTFKEFPIFFHKSQVLVRGCLLQKANIHRVNNHSNRFLKNEENLSILMQISLILHELILIDYLTDRYLYSYTIVQTASQQLLPALLQLSSGVQSINLIIFKEYQSGSNSRKSFPRAYFYGFFSSSRSSFTGFIDICRHD